MTVREKPVPCRYERVVILIKKTTFIFSSVFVISFIGLVKNNTNLSTETQYQLGDFPLYSHYLTHAHNHNLAAAASWTAVSPLLGAGIYADHYAWLDQKS